jgi:hypothetical protein
VAGKLAIICGGGAFPTAVAEVVRKQGSDFVLFGIRGFAEPGAVERFPHEWIRLGQLGRLQRLLRQHGAGEVTFVGTIHRPRARDIRVDWATLAWLPRYLAAQKRGDNHLLSFLVTGFESEGITVRGVQEVAPQLLVPPGVLGRHRPGSEEEAEIRLGREVICALGRLDVGQAAVVVRGRVAAVEAAEGTEAMLARVAELRRSSRIRAGERTGVLVKAPKPGQERRVDLPAIGADTVRQAAAAGLAGIAVEARGTIVADAEALVRTADAAGLFVLGFEPAPGPPP